MPSARMPVLLVVAAGVLFGTAGTAQALGPQGTAAARAHRVVATVLGLVVLGEVLEAVQVVGVVVILGGLLLQGGLASRASPQESEPAPVL